MTRMLRSLGFALEGLWHALRTECNLQLFIGGYIVVGLLGIYFHFHAIEWAAITVTGGTFIAVELLNTAFERLVDTFDVERRQYKPNPELHLGLKATKDVAAAAALISFTVTIIVLCIVFYPHLRDFFGLRS